MLPCKVTIKKYFQQKKAKGARRNPIKECCQIKYSSNKIVQTKIWLKKLKNK